MKGDRRGKRWTKEEDATLIMLAGQGKSISRASSVLKRTQIAVFCRSVALGVPLGRKTVRSRKRTDDGQPELPLYNGDAEWDAPPPESTILTNEKKRVKRGGAFVAKKCGKADIAIWAMLTIFLILSSRDLNGLQKLLPFTSEAYAAIGLALYFVGIFKLLTVGCEYEKR